MRTVKFDKGYIKKEFQSVTNAEKTHGMLMKGDGTLCGMRNEVNEYIEGKINCPDCIDVINFFKELKKGIDY